MCGTKLKMINGRMTCKDCGYYVRESSSLDSYSAAADSYTSPQSSTSFGSSAVSQNNAASGGSKAPGAAKKAGAQPKTGHPVKNILVILGSAALLVLAMLLRSGVIGDIVRDMRDSQPAPTPISREPIAAAGSDTLSTAPSTAAPATKEPVYAKYPESQFFRSFIEAVYGKGYRVITAEEYAAITAFRLDRDRQLIYFQVNHGETQSLFYASDSGRKLSDLSCFPGLEWLYLEDDGLSANDLSGLDSLYGVYSENTLNELAEIIPHPENIVELGVEDSLFIKNLDGIESFPSLLYLTVDCGFLEDISALGSTPGLLGLTLTGCDRLTDYSPLMSMTRLESLSIESSQLKTIDFIKQMPNLTYLSIEDTQIKNIDALRSCPSLTYLKLYDNYSVEDYSVVGELTELTTLALGVTYDVILPSFEKLTSLSTLSMKGCHDLTPLKDAVNVTALYMEYCTSQNLEVITAMQGLTTLSLNDFSYYTTSLEPLTRLPNLVALDISESNVFGNIEEIFGIPSLKYLYMDDCMVGIDFEALPANENLQVLSMCDTSILEDPSSYDRTYIDISGHCDMFASFPNLSELYLASDNLDDIDFVTALPNLQYLDISNNNIVSLTPLLQLDNFRIVWCGQNSILEKLPDDSVIMVLTNERE